MEVVKKLGKGSFGEVDLVKFANSDDGSFVHVARKSSHAWNYDYLHKEIRILSKLRGCRGIVQSFNDELHVDSTRLGFKIYRLFLEYAEGGTLDDLMGEFDGRRMPVQMTRQFSRMILEGLVSLHGNGFVHCDLKPGNILVFPSGDGDSSASYEVKIADFGISREVGDEDDWWKEGSPFWGDPVYMSPESVNEGKIGKALDIWSMGCVVFEMLTGELPWPFDENEEEKIKEALRKGDAPEIPENLPRDAREFLETCLARNPEERGTVSDLLKHKFITGEEGEKEKKADVEECNDHETELQMATRPEAFETFLPCPRPQIFHDAVNNSGFCPLANLLKSHM
ncbi:PREDICTED: mitogen-activated protein kinase kinase kinase 1-like [Tarenaya hassleriana]|uniref:mitogen-activated protein kinase kinase kinase 1-like n=1 Tax=Tarenaya hassleriana TaxID=28532 RepID=UPI00053CAA6F|nr:PREDICTED: mitogen-activated protein kinase kinase kinase 1-like [Tarenaya hassleriana]